MALSVQPVQQPTLNPKVVTKPTQPTLAPKVVTKPVQPTLNPKVVTQPQQPQFNPQVQPLAPQPQINVDNSPRFVPLGEAVKAKYPGIYDSIDNGVLGKTVAIKYPGIYDSLIEPAVSPQSEPEGVGGLKGFALGATKGALNTFKNVSGYGEKIASKLPGGVAFPLTAPMKLAGKVSEK